MIADGMITAAVADDNLTGALSRSSVNGSSEAAAPIVEGVDVQVQFETAVADLLVDGRVRRDDLHRWLTARDGDVAKAKKMLLDSLAWRHQIGADDLSTDSYRPPEVLRKYFPVGLVGHDNYGRPVWIIPFGRCDLRGLMQSAKKSDYVKYCVHLMERSLVDMKIQSELSMSTDGGALVQRHVVVVDLDNFGLRQATFKEGVDLIVHVAGVLSDNYPEVLESVYVVNTPKVFEVAYAVLRKFVNETTIRKFHVFGHDKWQEALLQEVDACELPVQWGGTKIDGTGDPCCPTLVCCGGDVPQSYYMAPANRLCEASNVQHSVVAKGSKLWIERQVDDSNCNTVLKWAFQTESNDIGFGVYHRQTRGDDDDDDNDRSSTTESAVVDGQSSRPPLTELIPNQRVNCHLVPEDGQLVCTKPGKYLLCFDNSFSRLRSKKLSYVVDLVSPDGHRNQQDE